MSRRQSKNHRFTGNTILGTSYVYRGKVFIGDTRARQRTRAAPLSNRLPELGWRATPPRQPEHPPAQGVWGHPRSHDEISRRRLQLKGWGLSVPDQVYKEPTCTEEGSVKGKGSQGGVCSKGGGCEMERMKNTCKPCCFVYRPRWEKVKAACWQHTRKRVVARHHARHRMVSADRVEPRDVVRNEDVRLRYQGML